MIGARFVTSKLRERLVRVGLGPGWRFGCGSGEESGSGAVGVVLYARVQVGCCDIFHQSVVSLTRLPRVCRCQ